MKSGRLEKRQTNEMAMVEINAETQDTTKKWRIQVGQIFRAIDNKIEEHGKSRRLN